jgi:thioredoxin reductase
MHREGVEPQRLTVPELDAHFQTAVPGQYLIGEVAGKPLVKNAANLGRLVVEHMVADGLSAGLENSELLDVVIVGSGPGGLSAGLTCLNKGLRCVVLEKEHHIASTVSRFPKGKEFMAEPTTDRNLSFLPVFDSKKEELLAAWTQVIEEVNLPVRKGEAVESIKRGEDGIFEVRTTVQSYRARRVVLAIGLRGKPRLLTVPGANLPKVHSILEDSEAYAGQHVLVVGGGDSALEASMSLADAGANTILSYRSKAFKRAKAANQKRIEEYANSGKVQVLLESNATEFDESSVTIKLATGESQRFPNDQAFLLIGAEAPVGWLEKVGVRFVERPHSYQLGKIDELIRNVAPKADDCPPDPKQATARVMGRAWQVGAAPVKLRSLPPPLPSKAQRRHQRSRTFVGALTEEWDGLVSSVKGVLEHLTPAPRLAEPQPGVTRVDLPQNRWDQQQTRVITPRPKRLARGTNRRRPLSDAQVLRIQANRRKPTRTGHNTPTEFVVVCDHGDDQTLVEFPNFMK